MFVSVYKNVYCLNLINRKITYEMIGYEVKVVGVSEPALGVRPPRPDVNAGFFRSEGNAMVLVVAARHDLVVRKALTVDACASHGRT